MILAVAVALAPPIAATTAAETNPGVGYPPVIHVEKLLDDQLPVGAKVSVFGYPRCERSGCMLYDQLGAVSRAFGSTVPASPLMIGNASLPCYEPNREGCVIVIYGRVAADRVVAEAFGGRAANHKRVVVLIRKPRTMAPAQGTWQEGEQQAGPVPGQIT